MQQIVVSRHLHPCHAIPVGGRPVGVHDEIDTFERCAAVPVDDLNGDFMVRRGDRSDMDAQRTRGMRDRLARAGEFHRPVVRAYVERRDSLNLGVLERAGPRPDCAGKSAGGNDGTALVTDSEGTAVELATTGALYADVESEGLASRDRRRDVPRIEMNVVCWTFRYRREGQGSAGIGLLRRNRQAQGDIEKNSFLTRHGLASRLANTF